MLGNLQFVDILLVAVPIAVIGAVYWLFQRFRKRPLSVAIHWSFRVTLVILTLTGISLLIIVGTGSGFVGLLLFVWVIYFLPATIGVFVLTWSIVTLAQPGQKGGAVTNRVVAIGFITLAVVLFIGYIYSETQCRIAGSPNAEPDKLRALYHSQYAKFDEDIARLLARNPATPGDVLLLLAKHGDITSRVNICYNPSTPISILEILASDKETYARRCVPFHKNVSTALLNQLANDPSADVRRSVAGKETAPADLLLKLSHDKSEHVLLTLVQNKDAPQEAVETLMQHKSANVRRMVAARDDLSLEMKLTLADDESKEVRRQLISKLHVPVEVLEKLKDDPDKEIQRLVWDRYRYLRRQKK